MSRFKTGLLKGICVAVVVPVLMVLAMPMRALMNDGSPEAAGVPAPDKALLKGKVTALDSLPLPDVTVTGADEAGNIIAMTRTGPNGEFTMEVPANVGKATVVAAGGAPVETEVKAGGVVTVNGNVPAEKIIGNTRPGWWTGMNTTGKAAIIGLPIAASAAVGFALADDGGSLRHASPVAP